jgi:hypothetical protein
MSQNISVIEMTLLELNGRDRNFFAQIPIDTGGYSSRSMKLHTYLILVPPRLVNFWSSIPTQ